MRLARPLGFMFVLLAALAFAFVPAFADEPRLDPNVAPTAESIDLQLDADQENYTGTVRIELRVLKPAKEFLFHAEEMTLDKVELTGKAGAVPVTVAPAGDRGTQRATAASELAPGDYALTIAFSKPYNTKAVGLYRVLHEKHHYLFTQFESLDARKAFPCWDEPIYKIPFQITLTVPLLHEAVTNTPVEKETRGATTKTIQFKRSPPMSSYLVAIASGPLESIPITGLSVPGRIYTVKGQKANAKLAAAMTPAILKAIEGYFGTKYPYEKLDFVAIPEYWFGAMENPGQITYLDKILLIDPAAATLSQKRRLSFVTLHEIAHMWFGDLVTMAWWDDLWLNESFADWLATKLASELNPEYHQDTEDVQEVNRTMAGDANATTSAIRKPVDSGADIMADLGLDYQKGRTVLRMVEEYIGPDVFQRGVRQYMERNKWKNAVAADLFAALSEASGKDLEPILSSYLDQPGFPLVRVDVGPNGMLTVSQKRFRNYGAEVKDANWVMPVRLKISDGKNVQKRVVVLDQAEAKVEVPGKVAWVMPDEGGVGYYRWVVPADMMMKLADNPEQTMTSRERTRFLGNTRALLNAGEITGSEYLAIAASVANHPEPEILTSVMGDLGSLRVPFVTDDLKDAYANYVRKTLAPARARYGLEPRADDPEDVKLLRPGLLSALGDAGRDPEVLAYCQKLAASYMADPASVDPSIAGTALAVAAGPGDRAMFDTYRAKFEAAKNPADRARYLGALGEFEDPAIQDELLKYALTDAIRPTEGYVAFGGLGDTEAGRAKIYNWMTANYAFLASRVPPEFAAYFPFYCGGCSEQRFAAAKKFFGEPAHRVDGTDENLAKVGEQINDCVSLREREGAAVAAYLRGLAP
jgi:aminopeptidase N